KVEESFQTISLNIIYRQDNKNNNVINQLKQVAFEKMKSNIIK
ncbi:MAG: LysR family transcriptional regulator, partial [Staphylococcus epidermidis]